VETREPLAADDSTASDADELPASLRLVRDLDVFEMPDGLGVQLLGGSVPVIVRGRQAGEALSYLLPRLAAPCPVTELVAARPAALTESVVRRTLSILRRQGLLAEGTFAEPNSKGETVASAQSLLFDRALGGSVDGTAAQRSLSSARVVLVAGGMFGAALVDLLTRSGCGHLSVLDWDDDGTALAAAEAVAAPGRTAHLSTTSVRDAERIARDWCDGAEILVTATRRAPDALFDALNGVCLERRRPRWLRADDDGWEYRIGPLVDPFESACFTCLRLRRTSAHPFAIEEGLHQLRLAEERPAGTRDPRGESLAGAALAAGIVALEVVRVLTRIAPPTLHDAELVVGPVHGSIRRHQFLRVPRCPACGVVGASRT
jgi:bacteriocin biosynthesis cyclodehydratase domain-containing protein